MMTFEERNKYTLNPRNYHYLSLEEFACGIRNEGNKSLSDCTAMAIQSLYMEGQENSQTSDERVEDTFLE